MKKITVISILFCLVFNLRAQELKYNDPVNVLQTIIIGEDTLPLAFFPEFKIEVEKVKRSKAQQNRFDKLQRNVMIVYPYAKLAGEMLNSCEKELESIDDEKERKKYLKKLEQDLEDEFGGELSDLTISQGVILIKLIDRETGTTSYDVVEELRGKFSAFFWQGLARLFGHNLKDKYEVDGDEKMIEEIMAKIESGSMPYYARIKNKTYFEGFIHTELKRVWN